MTIVAEIKADIAKLQLRLTTIQSECTHPAAALSKIAKGDTGNYDPSADYYWYECHCLLCDKQWREPQ